MSIHENGLLNECQKILGRIHGEILSVAKQQYSPKTGMDDSSNLQSLSKIFWHSLRSPFSTILISLVHMLFDSESYYSPTHNNLKAHIYI
jgi:hypothetical protein